MKGVEEPCRSVRIARDRGRIVRVRLVRFDAVDVDVVGLERREESLVRAR